MSQYERQEKSRRKHEPSNSGTSRAPVAPARRPGWKGPGYIKKAAKAPKPQPAAAAASSAPTIQPECLPIELQQLVLNIFRSTFPALQDPETLKPVLRDIKIALSARDLETAFGKEEWLEAYAARWSPSRLLGYVNLLAWAVEECKEEAWVQRLLGTRTAGADGSPPVEEKRNPPRVVCIGGGAAELMAFGALARLLRPETCGKPLGEGAGIEEGVEKLDISSSGAVGGSSLLDLRLVDSAPWGNVISKLHSGLTTPPALSKYASASARASNASFLQPGTMDVSFTQADVLALEKGRLKGIVGDDPAMVTLFFTLNELYTTDVAKSTKFLLELSFACAKDSLLCVIDSPGSYSETAIGKADEEQKERKKYPMHWLMDHALLRSAKGKGGDGEGAAMWEKLIVDESRWYKLDESLDYPIGLENIKFQVHLFKRL